jgi:hypothetical protein
MPLLDIPDFGMRRSWNYHIHCCIFDKEEEA